MTNSFLSKNSLRYHSGLKPGKIEIHPIKPCQSDEDLLLAYSPGVAEPCLRIKENPDDVYKYTIKGNLVAVITNGTSVMGLGNIGAFASKPVMEGKVMLFKRYADIDAFDIELDTTDIDVFVKTVKTIAPTFGAINLEHIKTPECFEIERRLIDILDIPVMHDDQRGTAIVSSAALLNACEIAGKKISTIRMVINGASAAAMACARTYISIGIKKENLLMVDSKGVISSDRTDLDKYKNEFALNTPFKTLQDVLKEADVFICLSYGDVLNKEMIQSMAENPIVFALAGPTPEISYENAKYSRDDIIFASGSSVYSNQLNSVLAFPYIFRGALDVRAMKINQQMKLAAVYALASLAKDQVFNSKQNDDCSNLAFGRDYILPKPNDTRLLYAVSSAVAKSAIETGVARIKIEDWEAYAELLMIRSKNIRHAG
jgi:malate dehydrogenase (oxaloacetate-decarboxylating)(NADP+)